MTNNSKSEFFILRNCFKRNLLQFFVISLLNLKFVSVQAQERIPPCPEDPAKVWDKCFGSYSSPDDGKKYVGVWRDNKKNGYGVLYRKDGSIEKSGLWENDELKVKTSARDNSPSSNSRDETASSVIDRKISDSEFSSEVKFLPDGGLLVSGSGLTVSEARKEGLRRAIEIAVGTLVVSERRVVNDELFRQDITYANGVIKSYDVIKTSFDSSGRLYTVTMKVTVSRSLVAERIIASQKSSNINGSEILKAQDSAQAEIESAIERHVDAKKYFKSVSLSLAERLFDVETGKVNTERVGDKVNSYFEVSVSVNESAIREFCGAAIAYQDSRPFSEKYEFSNANFGRLRIMHAYSGSVGSSVAKIFSPVADVLKATVGVASSVVTAGQGSGPEASRRSSTGPATGSEGIADCDYPGFVAEVEREIFVPLVRSVTAIGICVDFVGADDRPLAKYFYEPKDPPIVAETMQRELGVGYYYNEQNRETLRVIRLAWGNGLKIRLTMPSFDRETLAALRRISARATTNQSCRL